MLLSLLFACHGNDPIQPTTRDSAASVEPSALDTLTEDFIQQATQENFTVGEGMLAFATYEHCCEPDVNCLGNNPSTPYGVIALPPAPEQTSPDIDSFWMWGTLPESGLTRSFRLRPDEAYVWIGTLPPRSKYFSYRSSIATRETPSGQRDLVIGSLGPSLNQLVVADDVGLTVDEIWGRTSAVVTAADSGVESAIIQWLLEAGLSPLDIHRDRLSTIDARLGLDEPADTLMGVMRIAVPDDPAALVQWQQDNGRVLRLTPGSDDLTAPFGREPLPPRGGEGTELPWAFPLRALEEAIRARWPEPAPRTPEIIAGFTETFDCIEDLSCYGDIRDRYATRTFDVTLPDDDAFLMVFGVNHERAGKSVYSNFSVMTYDNRVGVSAVESTQMPGSARPYLGEDYPLVDDLYAWVVSRDCDRFDLPCLEVQDTCPHPEPSESFYITSRMYLDPNTGVAPGDGELLIDRVLEFGSTP